MQRFSSKVPAGVRRLVRLPWTRERMKRDLEDEWRFHLEARAAELRTQNPELSQSDAMAEAQRRFGDLQELRGAFQKLERVSARRLFLAEWLDDWAYDLRYAIRQFRRSPGFSFVAVFTLAIGIGANAAIFSVVNRILLDPVPFPGGNRVVALRQVSADGGLMFPMAGSMVRAWSGHATTIEAIANLGERQVHADEAADRDSIQAAVVTSEFMRVVGLRPALGRSFNADEARSGSGVVMIGHALWRGSYAGRRSVIGSTIHLNGKPYVIIGVTPTGMAVPMSLSPPPDVWLPYDLNAIQGATFGAFARLRPGVTTDVASAELQAAVRALPDSISDSNLRARVVRPREFVEAREATTLRVLFAAVGLLVLIACANVANLLLARAWNRRREFAVRVALGAGRSRLIRQVMAESLTLAVVGGSLGVLLAWEGLRIIIAMRPPSLQHLVAVHLDSAVVLWSAALALGSGLLFGAAPAILATDSIGDAMRASAGGAGGAANLVARKIRGALVVSEVALALVLLVGAGLLVRSFVALQHMDVGFDRRGLMSIGIHFARGVEVQQREDLRAAFVARVAALPGVTGAAVGTLPSTGFLVGAEVQREGGGGGQPSPVKSFTAGLVTPNYFTVSRIPIVEGRTFDSTIAGAHEAVVNRTLARRLWPDGHALGSRFRTSPKGDWTTVVGIATDVRVPWFGGDRSDLQIYTHPPINMFALGLLVRSSLPIGALMPMLRHAAEETDSRITLGQATDADELVSQALSPSRFATTLLGAFGAIALLLSAVGLYGVVAYAVSQRTREIGVRVALGARPEEIRRLVVGHGVRLATIGIAIGLAGAAAVVGMMRGLLYGVAPLDVTTFVSIAVVLLAVAALASLVPAHRALRIDPMDALRAE